MARTVRSSTTFYRVEGGAFPDAHVATVSVHTLIADNAEEKRSMRAHNIVIQDFLGRVQTLAAQMGLAVLGGER